MDENLVFGDKYSDDVIDYFKKEGLFNYFSVDDRRKQYATSADVFKHKGAFVPEMDDLVRLHKLIRQRKVFTVLEFGVGYSTIVMADAIVKNKKDFDALHEKPDIRNDHKFKIFSLDTSSEWVENTKKILPLELTEYIQFETSDVHIGTFNDRICHYFDKLPNIIPDFVYVDGPFKSHIQGSFNGLNFVPMDFTPISADLLLMEPVMLPGTLVVLDGRTNNARFLKNNFQRNWNYNFDSKSDVNIFELVEEPLGPYNETQLNYCLGTHYFKKLPQKD